MKPLSASSWPLTKESSPIVSDSDPFKGESINLSRYFPAGTQYFYGYPAGEDSHFFNNVPPASEECVAARALACAGDHVKSIVFGATLEESAVHLLQKELGVFYVNQKKLLSLPGHITPDITGKERNSLIKSALEDITESGRLVMAQPFQGPLIQKQFQFAPDQTIWLNDKMNLPLYVPQEYLPERYAEYENGQDFAETRKELPVPCVVKVSSSSSGDGVRICLTAAQLEKAKREYAARGGSIIIEQFVEYTQNFGIQFGISHDKNIPIDLIGVSEQLTTPEGEFVGGIVDPAELFPKIDGVNHLLLEKILPAVREMGWYGIGGFDVLIDRDGRPYMEDPNFRMTGMTAYLCEARNGVIQKPMVSFNATFKGTERDFIQNIVPFAREGDPRQMIHIIALTHHDDIFRMSAAMYFDPQRHDSISQNAAKFIELGLESKAFKKLKENGREKYPNFPLN